MHTVTEPIRRQKSGEPWKDSPEIGAYFESLSNIWYGFSYCQVSRNQEAVRADFSIWLNDTWCSPQLFFTSCFHYFKLNWPRSFDSKGESASALRHNKCSILLAAQTPTEHFGLQMPLSQQDKKGITVIREMINPYNQGEIGLLLYNRDKKICILSAGDLSWLSAWLCLELTKPTNGGHTCKGFLLKLNLEDPLLICILRQE